MGTFKSVVEMMHLQSSTGQSTSTVSGDISTFFQMMIIVYLNTVTQ